MSQTKDIRAGVIDDLTFDPDHAAPCRELILLHDIESFPSCLCLAGLRYVDGLGELSGTPGAAAELAQDAPGLELGVGALAGCTGLCVGAVGFFLGSGLFFPRYGVFA